VASSKGKPKEKIGNGAHQNGRLQPQKRMIDRRKQRLASLKAARPDAPFKLLLKLYRAELEKEQGRRESVSKTSEDQDALAALRQQLLNEGRGDDVRLGDLEDGDASKNFKTAKKKKKGKTPSATSAENKVDKIKSDNSTKLKDKKDELPTKQIKHTSPKEKTGDGQTSTRKKSSKKAKIAKKEAAPKSVEESPSKSTKAKKSSKKAKTEDTSKNKSTEVSVSLNGKVTDKSGKPPAKVPDEESNIPVVS